MNYSMLARLKNRAIIALTLFLFLLSICIYHQVDYQNHLKYPLMKQIVSSYPDYIGETVCLSGEVLNTGETSFQLLVSYEQEGRIKSQSFTVIADNLDLEIGDRVEMLGTLGENYDFTAEKTIISKEWKYYFIFIRSVVAIPILSLVFFGNWRFDLKQLKFIGRG